MFMNTDSSRVVWNFSGARSAVRCILLLLCLLSFAEAIGFLSWATWWYGGCLGGPIADVWPYCPAAFPVLSSIGGIRPNSSLAGAVSSVVQMGCWGAFSFGTVFVDEWVTWWLFVRP